MSPSKHYEDVEKAMANSDYAHLTNNTVHSFSWDNITVTVKDRSSKQPLDILSSINGRVEAGEMLALMGPSGSGKTTLLDVLAHRAATSNAAIQQTLCINGTPTSLATFRKLSSYVEQEDALIGSLTLRETLYFAAQLALPSSISKTERKTRIEGLLSAFGLRDQANTLVGTPIRKGVSGGQKRRLSVASQLITSPKILFLDEPTSGLDSAASFEVIKFVKDIAKKYKVLVIASIHQPSTTTFALFDKLMLLSCGKVAYNGPVSEVKDYFESLGYNMPLYTNPAEFIIQLVNTDFSRDTSKSAQQLEHLHTSWSKSQQAAILSQKIHEAVQKPAQLVATSDVASHHDSANPFLIPFTLIHRSFIKSYRDVVVYGIRIAMYMGLAIMMGTVWLRLTPSQTNIQAFINAIFFGGAFMSFMAVAYIPAYLEDLSIYTKERANGLYGPTAFITANFLIGIPYLFLITVLFSLISYWLGNFTPTASGFFTWVLWLFLDLLAAESLVVLLSSLIPIFVVALAATAFANGLWMCVNGFMVQPQTLNVFWRYVFHYIDYQAYVFRGMMVNEFGRRDYTCTVKDDGVCQCMYPSALQDQCLVEGKAVLGSYGYKTGDTGRYVGYLLVIVFVYRLLGWLVLFVRKQ
ncbi:ATP-binding cassette transporter-like protein [Cucurbitaria berberidis CBS 394.84]|uniref:ATP-binding cassette transporter-like protein n=1 Tax=Cucurbitaria berberidis CBS 394.84 TaxID=1168544 RepID=A0A9P4LE50_9PLEO|nr:ATP-binding cassette transporter-like protein [Cucurbitaria berberidis CBS 394.84]KAF1851047.1 ATP-binding cassette transporter-like protein [Cucurbitaria berberidis CBS 394.84]